jgi:integrase
VARKPQVRYFASRKAYFTTWHGKQHKLAEGPDDAPNGQVYLSALTAFQGLMELANADRAGQNNLVRTVFELYAQHLEKRNQLRSLKIFCEIAKHAVEDFGDVSVSDLKLFHVEQFFERMSKPRPDKWKRSQKWGQSYQAFALRALKAALNWGLKQELIVKHPLRALKIVAKSSRGEEAYVPGDVLARIIGVSTQDFAGLLRFMSSTGCRPDEAYHVEARYYHPADKCVVFPGAPKEGEYAWKNATKNSERVDRIIYLIDSVNEMVAERCKRYPKGRIFRNKLGRAWRAGMVGKSLRYYAAKLGVPVPTAYGLRHTFATDYLLAGGDIKILSDLMGTSVRMIEKHYGHLQIDRKKMRSIMLGVLERKNGDQP